MNLMSELGFSDTDPEVIKARVGAFLFDEPYNYVNPYGTFPDLDVLASKVVDVVLSSIRTKED